MLRMFSLVCVKCIFLWFCRSVQLEGINKYTKEGITSAMEQGSKFTFDFGSTCATRCKFLGALPQF